MKVNVFTTASVENADHNTSSTTATDSSHSTSISLFQHPLSEQDGELRDVIMYIVAVLKEKKLLSLPES